MRKKLLVVIPLLLLVAAGSAWLLANRRARSTVDARIEQMLATGAYEDISYDSLQVQANGDLTMSNLRVVNPTGEFILQDIVVSNFDYTSEFPRNLDVRVRGLRLPAGMPQMADGSTSALAMLLATQVVDEVLPLEVDYLHRYEPAQDFRLAADLRMALPGAFLLQVSSQTSSLDLQAYNDLSSFDPDPAVAQLQLMEKLGQLEIARAALSLQDQGMVEVMLADMAEQYGSTTEDMRTLLTSQVSNLHLFAPQNLQQMALDTGNQLAAFLAGGKTLSISVTPQLGGRMSELQTELMAAAFIGNFARMVELLELEIVTR